MAKAGRPPIGTEPRKGRLLVCLEPRLRIEIAELAAESRRSLSDYCRYVLEQHVLAVKEEPELTIEENEMEEMAPPPKVEAVMPRCGNCGRLFNACEC